MRIAFIADVHGNLEALEAALRDIELRSVDKVYCLGDLVGYGPDPEAVVSEIEKRRVETIMGNYDDAVGYGKESCGCSYAPGRETEIGDTSLSWSIKNTSDKVKKFLKKLPRRIEFEVEKAKFLLVHGSPLDELLEYVTPLTSPERLKEIVSATEADVVVSGHTHLPMARWVHGKLLINPGSVGRPKDGDPRASYMMVDVEGGVISWNIVRVTYDVKKTCEKIASRGLPAELSVVLALGKSYNMGPSTKTLTFNV